jgi:hypothetical protein
MCAYSYITENSAAAVGNKTMCIKMPQQINKPKNQPV